MSQSIIPKLGFGTFRLQEEVAYQSVLTAIEEGFRHIDTAQIYGNEEAVGRAIKDSGVARGELFITTKVWNDKLNKTDFINSVKESLTKLQLDYVDLLLIHWPSPANGESMDEYLTELQSAKELGLTKKIGVSNFTIAQMEEALSILPKGALFTNQVEVHPYLTNQKVRDFCTQNDILVTGYMPFAVGKVLKDPTIKAIANKHKVSTAEVVIAWELAHDMVTIPSSTKRENMATNLKALSLSLSQDEINQIDALSCGDRQANPDFAPDWDHDEVKTTHAWQFQGADKALTLGLKAVPALKAGQILVRNLAIGINPVDWKFIQADPINWPDTHTPGVDGAGVVEQVGDGVDTKLIGKTVAYHHSLSENGSFAKHSVLYAERVMQLSKELAANVAAALPCPLLTAWQAFSKIPLRKDEKVLVTGMGAVNKLLSQMLNHSGFEVHALSKSLTAEQAEKLGVKLVLRDAPSEGGYFALFDANGPEETKKLVPLLQANGHVISILGRIETPVDEPFTRTISYHEIALGALHDYGDTQQWQRLVSDGEKLLNDIASGTLNVEEPTDFEFNNLNDALEFSKVQKQKAVVVV